MEKRPDMREMGARLRERLARPLDVIVRYLAAFAEDDARPEREEPVLKRE